MTVPTNIPETPIVHTEHESSQGSKGKKISIYTVVLQHVLKTIMDIQDDEEVESFSLDVVQRFCKLHRYL